MGGYPATRICESARTELGVDGSQLTPTHFPVSRLSGQVDSRIGKQYATTVDLYDLRTDSVILPPTTLDNEEPHEDPDVSRGFDWITSS